MRITSFFGVYRWLSNFHPAKVRDDFGNEYPSVEHAYQAMKTEDLELRKQFQKDITSGKAKRLGQKLQLVSDWEESKIDIMLHLLRQKFSIPELREKLLQTGDAELVEGNTWGDQFWGVCNGVGTNWLGRLLMKVREEQRAIKYLGEK